MLTGARRGEIGGMRWGEVDFERRLWTLPAARSKNARAHEVPLSDQAFAELTAVTKRTGRAMLFGRNADRGFSNWPQHKSKLDRLVTIAPWQVHDLRRSVVTNMAEGGVAPHIIEAIVNHVSGHKAGVAGVYNRATYIDEKRISLQRWADRLDEVITGNPSKVVALRTA